MTSFDDLKLGQRELAVADAVGGDLETVFHKRNEPARQNGQPERRAPVLQMTIPRKGHENIREHQKSDRGQACSGQVMNLLERFRGKPEQFSGKNAKVK